MCAARKKKNERNEMVCFYSTQSDILLCGMFSRGNKNKLRAFQSQKWKKQLRTASPKQNLLVLIKKRVYLYITHQLKISAQRNCNLKEDGCFMIVRLLMIFKFSYCIFPDWILFLNKCSTPGHCFSTHTIRHK